MKFILLNLVLASPLIKVVRNPRVHRTLKSGDGSTQSTRPLLFKFNKEVSDEMFDKHWFNDCMAEVKVLNQASIEIGKLNGSCDIDEMISEMESDDNIEFVEKDQRVYSLDTPNDTYMSELWGMSKILAEQAWNIDTGSQDVVVGVIDTGVDYTHPDLKDNMWVNPGEIPGNGIDDDGNGYVDDVHGINAILGTGDPMDPSDEGHGTHCAGTIAGRGDNGQGVAGVMWKAKILACNFLGGNGGWSSDAVECLNYVLNYASISSNSWGGPNFNRALNDLLNANPQHLFIAAAGNDNQNHDVTPSYPCDYTKSLCVASTTASDSYSSFSDYGGKVDIAAPGSDILSTWVGGGYKSISGTSMATPHVSGLAGLLLSYRPDLSMEEIRQAILTTGDSVSGKLTATNSRINAYRAIQSIADGSTTPTTTTTPDAQCQDDSSWRDSDEYSCATYVDVQWCENGTYGSRWQTSWGSFSDYAVNGVDASDACCACGKTSGSSPQPSTTQQPTTQQPTTQQPTTQQPTTQPPTTQPPTTTTPLTTTSAQCQDDVAWRSSSGSSCAKYTSKKWCEDGTYGSGWRWWYGSFSRYGKDGVDASHACCACGKSTSHTILI